MLAIIRRSVCLGGDVGEQCARRLMGLGQRQFALFGGSSSSSSDEKEPKTATAADNTKPAVDEKTPEELAAEFQRHEFKNEQCLLVNEEDRVIGKASKVDCHKVRPDGSILLHRAFSVFMFNSKGLLLLQKRSPFKITYPEHYTNTCCSHPIVNVAGEDDETEALGIRRAAQRRLNYEMGIPLENIPLDQLKYITRVRYMDTSTGSKWGENEIDYILFFKSDFDVKPNPNEICEIAYVPRADIDQHLTHLEAPLTPWFRLILKYKLKLWWDNIDSIEDYMDHVKITNLTPNSDL